MFIFNSINKKRYVYQIDNFYHGVPNTVEYYQNEDQKKINKRIKITNDEYGFRNDKNSIIKKDVLFLGDSFIRGMNTEDDKLLSNIISNKIYNAGMDGFSSFNSVEVAEYLFQKNQFKQIVLFFTMNNDFRDNIFQYKYKNNLESKIILIIKNNSFLNKLFELRFLFKKNLTKEMPLKISEINKPYYSINYLKLLINDKKFVLEAKNQSFVALKKLKQLSIKNNAKLTVIGIPNASEIYKDINKIHNLKRDLNYEGLQISNIPKNIDFENPKKIFFLVCKKANIKCLYLPLNKNSFYELDNHWNDHGQSVAKDYILNNLNFKH